MSLYFQSEEKNNLKVLLGLLEKAEQILGLINLPDTTINKYNHLKEITFEKLNLDYKPINKKSGKVSNISNRQTNNSNLYDFQVPNNTIDQFNKLRIINLRKTIIIEYLFELIEKFKFENNNYMKQYFLDNQNSNINYLIDKAIGNLNIYGKNSNIIEEFDFELKLEELKIKDFIGKSDICHRKFLTSMKSFNNDSFSYNSNNLTRPSSAMFNNNLSNQQLDEIISEYEKKIEDLKWSQENEIKEYKEKFNELKIKYNPDLENEYYKLRESFDIKSYIIDELNQFVEPIYEKYYNKNIVWYEKIMIDSKYDELLKVHFLSSLVNKFFSDNKYLLDLVSDVQKEKNNLIEERNLPYVINSIQKNNILQEINSDLNNFDKNNDLLYKNIDQMIEYMNKNIESLI